ncbi:hypothetical protein V6R21_09835 [Limibacter armeniacum]|uniref:hypothetical protein n=1 Tax=Limibacter armeniacum TaxID=466084 RepID=UPI002FE6BAAC
MALQIRRMEKGVYLQIVNRRANISFILLLIYAFSFLDFLIPHCQELVMGELGGYQHHKEHHVHEKKEPKVANQLQAQAQIEHEGHFDTDLYDLMICVLSEMEHAADDCNIVHYVFSKLDGKLKLDVKEKLATILLFVFYLTTSSSASAAYTCEDVSLLYLSPPLDSISLRGPPVISC